MINGIETGIDRGAGDTEAGKQRGGDRNAMAGKQRGGDRNAEAGGERATK